MQSAVCHTRLLNKQQGPGNFVREVNGSQHLMDSLEEKSNPTGHLFFYRIVQQVRGYLWVSCDFDGRVSGNLIYLGNRVVMCRRTPFQRGSVCYNW